MAEPHALPHEVSAYMYVCMYVCIYIYILMMTGWSGLIFFSFSIGNFCCCANFFGFVYFVLDFVSINFFMNFKMKKILTIHTFF